MDAEIFEIPLLPLRDIVLFPRMLAPLFVGRERSIQAVEEAFQCERKILVVTQRDPLVQDPEPSELYAVGTLGHIVQLLRLPDGTLKTLIEGLHRGRIEAHLQRDPYLQVRAAAHGTQVPAGVEAKALGRSLRSAFETFVRLSTSVPPELLGALQRVDDPGELGDTVAAHLPLSLEQKQKILEIGGLQERLEELHRCLQAEVEILQVERRIRSRVRRQMERSQKEHYLNEQMQAIQQELGGRDEFRSEVGELETRLADMDLPEQARTRAEREIAKLKLMPPMTAEAAVVRNYVDWILTLPWGKRTERHTDLAQAEAVLDEDHYGLRKVKERIVEHLAVELLVEKMRGPILCLVGPPGVGKTSLGRSIARATNRPFVRMSLGGLRDEAEIRGHRRTYIGAMPGKIVQSLKRAGAADPVLLLDEIDKMAADFRGDPASALLEVLDPEQNTAFNDHYLDLDLDLSDVMFVTTANSLDGIPIPLRDRMEIIELSGYTEQEKLQIAKRYLLPKQRKENGLEPVQVAVGEEALRLIIRGYTKEAGVRTLERKIAAICRKLARRYLERPQARRFRIGERQVSELLGLPLDEAQPTGTVECVGLANGLAVTAVGGELLVTEVTVAPGQGKLSLTGKLGEVMRESAQAALSYLRSRAASLGLDPGFYRMVDLHVHCPEGAIPKDGPSAGITIATAMASALLRVPVRQELAMTGEVTLSGRVLRVGGLRDKLLAAHRHAIPTVMIPAANQRELADIDDRDLRSIRVVGVEHMDQVLRHALVTTEAMFSRPTEVVDWRVALANPSKSTH